MAGRADTVELCAGLEYRFLILLAGSLHGGEPHGAHGLRIKANPQKKLVGLELVGHEPAVHGDCVHIGRGQVGVITSGMLSPKLGKNIALCRIDVKYSEIGTEVEIGKLDGHQKRIGAKVVPFPFYDPTKSRVRA